MEEEWGEYLEEASKVIEAREKYQRTLGRLSSVIAEKYGPASLKAFSETIRDTYGLTVSPATLKNYRWVWNRTNKLNLPDDLAYRTLQYIASSERPSYWAKRIKDEGLSSVDVYYMLREEKGHNVERKRMTICPKCEHEFQV